MEVLFAIKSFQELSTMELYDILKLRAEVFIVEQNSLYQDIDNKDISSYHLICNVDGHLAGYTRLLPQGLSYSDVSIGRVVIGSQYRNLGLGKELMHKSIAGCENLFGKSPIRISAQFHLSRFYNSFGFEATGEPYDEDGILHIEMVRAK